MKKKNIKNFIFVTYFNSITRELLSFLFIPVVYYLVVLFIHFSLSNIKKCEGISFFSYSLALISRNDMIQHLFIQFLFWVERLTMNIIQVDLSMNCIRSRKERNKRKIEK